MFIFVYISLLLFNISLIIFILEILMYTIEEILEILYNFYNVKNNIELAEKMNTTNQNITNWKSRNAISAVKKKCRELGIYQDIFGDNTTFNQYGNKNQQINSQINQGNSECESIDKDILQIVKALNETAKAVNKKEELKKELTNLISKIATL